MSDTPLVQTKPIKPTQAAVSTLVVLDRVRLSSGFVRITFASTGDDFDETFDYMGYDHWFRMFFPGPDGSLELPRGGAEGWYQRLLDIPEETRPPVRNYTIRDARRVSDGWRIEIDFVVHTTSQGTVDGIAATWALNAQPGDRVGVLDQGILFHPPDPGAPVVIVADETGVPGVEGIARCLPEGIRGVAVLEVPHDDDRRRLESDADLEVRWVRRAEAEHGSAARPEVESLALDPAAYVYAVGEASFVLETRSRALEAGLPKSNVDFCAYWRPTRRAG